MTFLLISTLGSQYRFILSYDIARSGHQCHTGIRRDRGLKIRSVPADVNDRSDSSEIHRGYARGIYSILGDSGYRRLRYRCPKSCLHCDVEDEKRRNFNSTELVAASSRLTGLHFSEIGLAF